MDSFLIKVKIYGKIKYVKFQREHFNLENFIITALTAFEINTDKDANVILRDSDDVIIADGQFMDVVTQFINCNHFHIKLTIISDTVEDDLVVELRFFLNQNKCSPLFNEYEDRQNLEPKSIQFLSDKVFQFIEEKYSTESRGDIENVCKSLITLFPNVKKVDKSNINTIDNLILRISHYFRN